MSKKDIITELIDVYQKGKQKDKEDFKEFVEKKEANKEALEQLETRAIISNGKPRRTTLSVRRTDQQLMRDLAEKHDKSIQEITDQVFDLIYKSDDLKIE